MMTEQQFYVFMKYAVEDALREHRTDIKLDIQEVMKTNNRKMTGLVIQNTEEGISPCVYLNDAFASYQQGTSLGKLTEEITDIFETVKKPDIRKEDFADYDAVKNRLTFHLVGIEENEEWLEGKLWEPCGDYARVCYLELGKSEDGYMARALTIKNSMEFGVDRQQIFSDAQTNLEQQPYIFRNISAVIKEMMGMDDDEGIDLPIHKPPLFVLTNLSRENGAVLITRPDIQLEIAEQMGSDYFVLPSSVHEVLVVPVTADIPLTELTAMVKEVNLQEVGPDSKLSDKVQYYDRETGKLTNAEEALKENNGREPTAKSRDTAETR